MISHVISSVKKTAKISKMNKPNQLAKRVVEWAQNELSYTKTINPRDVKKLCRGEMVPIFQYLLKHIKSREYPA